MKKSRFRRRKCECAHRRAMIVHIWPRERYTAKTPLLGPECDVLGPAHPAPMRPKGQVPKNTTAKKAGRQNA